MQLSRTRVSRDFWANSCTARCTSRTPTKMPCTAFFRENWCPSIATAPPTRSARTCMTELSFVDTNILVYAYDSNQTLKRSVASDLLQRLWQERTGRASMQVMNEFYVT